MEPAGGVEDAAVTIRRHHLRGALLGVGVAMAAGLFVLLAPAPAHADDGGGSGSGGLLGGVVSDLTGVVDSVVSSPVVEPLPSLRELPVVGVVVGGLVDSKPVGTVTAPVSGLVDGLLGDTVASLPVVVGLLGDRPIGGITDPIAGTVDDALGELASGPGLGIPPVLFPQADSPVIQADAAVAFAASGITAVLLPVLARADDFGAVVVGAGNSPLGGFAGVPGDSMPTSAVTASGPPGGLAAAVLGAGLLLLFFAGRIRPELFRAPPSPTFDTDSSPD